MNTCVRKVVVLACVWSFLALEAVGFSGKQSQWQGYDRFDFEVAGRACWVVVPQTVAEGQPWIWRARFFGHEPQVDLALLAEGFHLAYCDVSNLFGSPQAVAIWDEFYEQLVEVHGLSSRPVLEGMSRGGLIVYNWAAANPQRVAAIYADAPVCDFKSWPGGKGVGNGSQGAWEACLSAYELSEAEALEYRKNPVDQLAPLALAGVPLLHVVGDADKVVPVGENTGVLDERYQALGGHIEVIHKPGVGHHPHSLEDPGPIVSFLLQAARPNVRPRAHLNNSWIRFAREEVGRVAFIGGSITAMNGYRPMVAQDLQSRFPETVFSFLNAGISSTCSSTGAFRLADDVFSEGRVDLLFIEFAVNDDQDAGHDYRECVRGMEGIIRQARAHNPLIDIVVTYFVNEGMLESLQSGITPVPIRAHEAVVGHYGVPSLHLAKEVAERINASVLTWQEYGGVHPAPRGNRIAADLIRTLFDRSWGAQLPLGAQYQRHRMPAEPLDAGHYGDGRWIDLGEADLGSGWEIKVPDWESIPGSKRRRFLGRPLLCAEGVGAELTLRFAGQAVGAYVLAGPDAGVVEASVDGGPFASVDLYHRFSKGLHYPRTVLFASDLSPGPHVLTLRVSRASTSGGNAIRILEFAAN